MIMSFQTFQLQDCFSLFFFPLLNFNSPGENISLNLSPKYLLRFCSQLTSLFGRLIHELLSNIIKCWGGWKNVCQDSRQDFNGREVKIHLAAQKAMRVPLVEKFSTKGAEQHKTRVSRANEAELALTTRRWMNGKDKNSFETN